MWKEACPSASRAARAALAVVLLVSLAVGAASAQPTLRDVFEKATGEPGATTVPDAPAPSPAEKVQDLPPLDELDRGTPQGAMTGFLTAVRSGDYERAARFLDLSYLPPAQRDERGAQLARHLRVILDQTLWIDPEELSTSPEGRREEGLSASRERVARISTPEGRPVDLLLERSRSDGVSIWKISDATLRQVPGLYEHYGYGFLGEILPAALLEYEIGGTRIWQAVMLLALVALAWVVGWIASFVARWVLRLLWRRRGARAERFLSGPLHLALGATFFSFWTSFLPLALTVRVILDGVETALLIAAFTWVVLRALDLVFRLWAERLARRGQADALPLLPPGRRTAKIAVVAMAILAVLASFGYNVTAVLAGLGVGGIALALAAQKSIENLFGGISLYADQPVKVGEVCRFGDKIGTVEEIGLRSTRIRTLERSVLTVPNSEFAQLQIDNLSRRERFWYNPTLGLRYETTPDQLRYILVEIRKILYAHPKVDPNPARVRFTAFNAYSLDVEVFAYIAVSAYDLFLEVAEDLNLRIMEVIERAGSGFAFPSQTTYLEPGSGVNRDAAKAAEEQVVAWRERGELSLPGFAPTEIEKLRNTLDYPPRGSVFASDRLGPGKGGASA